MVYARVKPGDRQRLINEYLNDTGLNMFVPHEFLDWLRERPNHPVYEVFFGMADEDAAYAHRIELVRKWSSGLRLTVGEQKSPVKHSVIVTVDEKVTLPAMFSPMAGRRNGGGYISTNPEDPEHVTEILKQSVYEQKLWLERYRGAATLAGVDLTPIDDIIRAIQEVIDSSRHLGRSR